MTIQWGLFVPGVLLLLFPADRLLSSRIELRSFDCFHRLGGTARGRPWWWVLALWLDPLRGFAGAYLLCEASAANFTPWAILSKSAYAMVVALVAAGVLVQTLTRRGDDGVLLAPLGFVAGVAFALMPWSAALIGVITGLLGLFGFRQFYAYFVFGGVTLGILGFVLAAPGIWVLPAAGVFLLPVLTGIVTNSTLELPARKPSVGRARQICP